jgi:hypothetical protein
LVLLIHAIGIGGFKRFSPVITLSRLRPACFASGCVNGGVGKTKAIAEIHSDAV